MEIIMKEITYYDIHMHTNIQIKKKNDQDFISAFCNNAKPK